MNLAPESPSPPRVTAVRCAGKVTIFELLWLMLLLGGGVIGFHIGHVHLGILGAVIGLILGLGTGLLVSCGVAYLLNLFSPK